MRLRTWARDVAAGTVGRLRHRPPVSCIERPRRRRPGGASGHPRLSLRQPSRCLPPSEMGRWAVKPRDGHAVHSRDGCLSSSRRYRISLRGQTQGSIYRCIPKTSPRTQCLHVTKNLRRLGPIPIVGGKRYRLGPERVLGAKPRSIDERRSQSLRDGGPIPRQHRQGAQRVVVRSESDGLGHRTNVMLDVDR